MIELEKTPVTLNPQTPEPNLLGSPNGAGPQEGPDDLKPLTAKFRSLGPEQVITRRESSLLFPSLSPDKGPLFNQGSPRLFLAPKIGPDSWLLRGGVLTFLAEFSAPKTLNLPLPIMEADPKLNALSASALTPPRLVVPGDERALLESEPTLGTEVAKGIAEVTPEPRRQTSPFLPQPKRITYWPRNVGGRIVFRRKITPPKRQRWPGSTAPTRVRP
ncbi:MAG: hypothetical protein LBS60_11915 [Deltaproteobacteria bacterium]|jgi:hypothetical protein|nr:hypothetical protein [Deltaproteobacteria bacterium]